MPFTGEKASKASHFDIVKNPEVAAFLGDCEYLHPPSEAEGQAMGTRFLDTPSQAGVNLPAQVIAVDGSYHESSLNEKLPSTKMGYVKIGCVLIDMQHFQSLRVCEGQFVDPFRVAALQRNNNALTFPLPSANLRLKGRTTVRESFRAAVDAHLYGENTRYNPDDPSTSLRTTLFHLATLRSGPLSTGDPHRLRLHKCPTCEEGPVEVQDMLGPQHCPHCAAEVFPADCLRVWEDINEFQANGESLSRLMMVVEHLLPIHYIRNVWGISPGLLSGLAFFVDGPLAVFGNAAWLHASVLRYLDNLNTWLKERGHKPLLMVGLQKTGQLVDHMRLVNRYVPSDRILLIDDDYRYKYVMGGQDASANGFGSETYYGQDFLYKTPSGRYFAIGLPYPFRDKAAPGHNFIHAKTELQRYTELPRALALVKHFECDLYENALIPIALAHRYTAISLVPGGRVLDLLTKLALEKAALAGKE